MPKISRKPHPHALEDCHLNSVDRAVCNTIISLEIRNVERVAFVDGLRGHVSLVETIRGNGSTAPRIACRVLS